MKLTFKHDIKVDDKITSDEIVSLLLKHRKISNINEFLKPVSPLKIRLKDFGAEIKKTIKLLEKIKKQGDTIVVYTDYDADGITGGSILWETLYYLGFKVMPYVPSRHHEGYGFSVKGIDNVIKQFNPALIISVDHGITKVKEVEYAKKKGVKIIITDHHLKQEKNPKAYAIFHIPALSGSGVSYFFSKEIFTHFKLKTKNFKLLEEYFFSDYLALAAIGTVADLVPLVGDSRSIVKYGLEAFPKVKRYGIRHILKEAGIEGKKISTYEVGFIIAPRINAAGRLGSAIDALRLLCTTDEERARRLAEGLGQTNRLRQDELEKSLKEALQMLEKDFFTLAGNKNFPASGFLPKIIILTSDHWNEGIIGLIASRIADQFYRPTLILTKSDDHFKGSARSISGFHITDFLRSLKKDYLEDIGGHTQAAGFNLEKNKLEKFMKAAENKADKLINNKMLERKTEVDLKIPFSKISLNFAKKLEVCQPFGIGNPQPTFLSQGELTGAQIFGKKNEHLKLFMGNLEFIAFSKADIFSTLSRGQKISIVYRLDINRWGGTERLRGIVSEILTTNLINNFSRN